jgi:plasmid rolling circle replication initiator protein Rep
MFKDDSITKLDAGCQTNSQEVNSVGSNYLSDWVKDYSKESDKQNKKKHNHCDNLKRRNLQVAKLFEGDDKFNSVHKALVDSGREIKAEVRMNVNTSEVRFKFSCWHSRCRIDPITQYANAKKERFRMFKALRNMTPLYPTHEFAFLTLTVRNCPITELRKTVNLLSKSFLNMTRAKPFSEYFNQRGGDAIAGFYRALEVTQDKHNSDYCHPHLHILLHLPQYYFHGGNGIRQPDIVKAWQKALGVDYEPSVRINRVKAKKTKYNAENSDGEGAENTGLFEAVCETAKYQTKSNDFLDSGAEWAKEYLSQMKGIRNVSTGGTIKCALANLDKKIESTIDDELTLDEEEIVLDAMTFLFHSGVKKYVRFR